MATQQFEPFSGKLDAAPEYEEFSGQLDGEPPKPAGPLRRLADTGLALAKGVVGVPESVVGVADLATKGKVGKLAEQAGIRFKDAKDVLTSFQSEDQQAADRAVQQADGFIPTLGAMVQNPSTIVNAAAESAPSMITGGAAARGMMRFLPKAGPITAGAVGEGVVAAGQNAEQVRQEAKDGQLTGEQAAILAGSGAATGAISRLSGGLANKLGIGDVQTMIAAGKLGTVGEKAGAQAAKKGALRKVAEGALVEGGLQELPQSAQEQAAQNIAQGKPWDEGVGAAAAQGLLVGGVTGAVGGGMGALSGEPESPPPAPAVAPPAAAPVATPAPGAVPSGGSMAGPERVGALQPDLSITDATIKSESPLPTIDPNAGPLSRAAALLAGPGGVISAPVPQLEGKTSPGASTGQPAAGAPGAAQSATQSARPAPQAAAGTGPAAAQAPLAAPAATPGPGQAGSPTQTTLSAPSQPPVAANPTAVPHETPRPQGPIAAAAAKAAAPAPVPAPASPAPANQPAANGAAAPALAAQSGPGALSTPTPTTPQEPTSEKAPEAVQGQARREEPSQAAPAVDASGAADQPAASPAVGAPVQGDAPPAGQKVVQSIDPNTGEITFAPEAPAPTIDAPANFAATSPLNDNPEPTEAQKKAGNYRKGHVKLAGLDLAIENPAGSTRKGVDKAGKAWENELQHHYGYIKGTIGNDKDHVDAFVKPETPLDYDGPVFVIDQVDPDTGKFDEHKVVIGAKNGLEARQIYRANYAKGWKGDKAVTEMTMPEFKAWVYDGPKNAPLAADAAPPPAAAPAASPGADWFLGKFGKGMKQANAEMKAANLNKTKTDPAITYVAEKHGMPDMQEEWGVIGRTAAATPKAEPTGPASVPSIFTGQRDPRNSGPMTELGEFKVGDTVDVPTKTIGRSTVKILFKRTMQGFGPVDMARVQNADEKLLDVLMSELVKVTPTAKKPVTPQIPNEPGVKYGLPTFASNGAKKQEAPRRRQPGDTDYTLLDARNDLLEMRTIEQGLGVVGDDRLLERIRRQEKLIADMEGAQKTQAPKPEKAADKAEIRPYRRPDGSIGYEAVPIVEAKAPTSDSPEINTPVPAAADGEAWWKSMTIWGRREALKAAGIGAIKGEVNWGYLPEPAREKLLALIGTPGDPIVKGAMEYVRQPEAPAAATDLNAMFDDVLGEELAKDQAKTQAMKPLQRAVTTKRREQAAAAPAPRTATQAAVSAAKNTGDALSNAIDGLGALFGAGSKGRLGSGLSFDEDTYAKAKPLFQAAIANLKDAAADLKEAMRTVVRMVLDKFGPEAAANMKPYVVRFVQDVQAGTLETPPQKADTAPKASHDSAPPTSPPAVDKPLDAGQPPGPVQGTEPIRGAEQPRAGDGRSDGPSVRDQRGRQEGPDDAGQDLGDRAGNAGVPDKPADPVGAGGGGVSARDFRPALGGLTRTGSWHETAKRNLDLIDLAIKIEAEKRPATPAEQEQLSKYVGFGAGAIRNEIFPIPSQRDRQQNPGRLIFPDLVRNDRWKPLAERAAALPIEWQRTILQSTQYAHYTSEGIIRSIWSAVQRLGFTGGKIMEPGAGIGSFAMLMPEQVHKTSKYTGIEFDGPTALIGRLLSPEQHVLHTDFIKRNLPDNFYDVAVGNPPFSQTPILADPRYEKFGFMLHDYFFAKAMDKVRPGGLLAFVTSKGTMDKKTDKARKFLADRADLVGAIRLPSTAFEDNAGTSVVTDVIFLRKRAPGEAPAGKAWTNVKTVETKDGPVVINEYYADNPSMVLGQHRISGNVDDEGRRINSNGYGGERYTLVSYDKTPAELDAKFAAAIEQLPANVYSAASQGPTSVVRETAKMDFDPKIKREGVLYLGKDGELLRVEEGTGKALSEVVKLSEKDKAWLTSYVGLRDLIQEARQAQVTDADWQGALKKLNKAYDAFVAKHGPVNAFRAQVRASTDEEGNQVESTTRVFTNRRLYREDYDSAIVTQIETIDEDGNIKKAPFLLGRTVGKPVTREVKSIGDALAVSLDEIGRLDIGDVAARMKIKPDEAIEALGKQVYKTPTGQWQLADEYLSGDVVTKLEEAMEASRLDRTLERNVEALREVQPEKLGPSQISVKLGAPWVGAKHVSEFAKEIEAGTVTFDPKTETWQVEGGNMRSERKAGAEFGTAKRSPSEILEAVLNSRSIKVMKTVANDSGKGTKDVVDTEATTAANEVAKKMKEKFRTWVWTDSERAADLVEAYNLRYNNIAPRRFDGSHLTLPGVSLRYKLHPHQLRAIWRQIQTGNVYLAHAVGAGKTIEMIAGGMEQKRLGLIKKPIYVVPNHMLEQFANEFMELYPLANIMVADDQNFSKERRKAFIAAATLNAPDAIVITHSAFERIGVKPESVQTIIDEIISDLQDELESVGKDSGNRVRRGQLEQQIEAVNQRFDSILAAGKKDGTVTFEEMGADYVYVDEAHTYRKLDFHTAQTIKGIDPNGSRRALDMYVKTRWLEKQRPGRSMTFASGTAVTNTMGEIYTIMRFFAPEILERGGIATFDSWARMFGEVKSALEPNAAGKYEIVERFSRFDNVPELMARVRQFMDVLQSDQLGAIVKRPDTEGGKPQMILVEPTKAMLDYQKNVLLPRLEESRNWKPSFDEPNNPDPVIAIITDGRFAATDPRFIPGGKVLKGEMTKIDKAADEILAEYKATAKNQYVDRDGKPMVIKGGTQIVFYNVGFGANAAVSRGFNSRAVFTKRLTDGGIRRDQIAWFDDADTDAKKEAVFKGMRNGTYRVLIGSAKKMGTGVNVQNRLTALHYMDPPWFPADVEQPRGRIIRQGNQNAVVREKWYATKGGYDSTMWQMVGRKQRFIDQAFSGDKNLRSMEDLGEASMYEQAAALASGDPRALQLAGLKQDVERLERQQAAHANEQVSARTALQRAQWDVQTNQQKRAQYEKARKVIGDYFTFTSGKVGATTYTKQGEFGQALKDAFNREAKAAETNPGPQVRQLATLGDGITLEMHAGTEWKTKKGTDGKEESSKQRSGYHELTITAGGYTMTVAGSAMSLDADTDALGLARKAINALNGVEADLRRTNAALAELEIDQTRLRKKIGAPFEYQQEMLEKHAELQQLEEELRLEGLQKAAERVMLDEKGVGWKVVKGPYKSNGVLMADVERLDDTGETVKATVAYATLKDVEAPPTDAGQGDTQFARTKRTGGVHMDDAKAVVAAIREALPTAPPIHILESVSKAPKELQRDIKAAGAENDVDAAYHNGEIYVFPANVPSIERLQFVLAHHEIRHHGLRAMLGPRMNQVLFQIHASNPAVRAAAQRQVEMGYAKSRVLATEEAIADMAVEDIVKLNGWDKIVVAVRQWLRGAAMRLRRAGLAKVADALEPAAWTDKDVAGLIARAEGVSRGGSAKYPSEGTVFGQDGAMPAFYSALSREISASAARAQPAQGWISSINGLVKAGKIKREELEWSGVLDWLQMQAEGADGAEKVARAEGPDSPFTALWKSANPSKVTREQLVKYLDANGVKVEETVLGGDNQPPGYDADIELLSDNGLTLERNPEDPGMVAFMDENGDLLRADELAEEPGLAKELVLAAYRVQEAAEAGKVPTKYGTYQLPGGTNYREVLLTLPEKKNAPVDSGKSAATMLFERDMMEKYGGDTFPSVYGKLSPSEIDKYEMYVREDRNAAKFESIKQDRRNNYKSSHWDQPNILAHIRVNDRTDAEGKRVLFVEEIQSDWGQEGKKQGFKPGAAGQRRFQELGAEWDSLARIALGPSLTEDAIKAREQARQRQAQISDEMNAISDAERDGLPGGPFVTKTDAWLSLALKRIVKMAVDEGYDRVAFVNGEQSAERYDLSKQVDSIKWRPNGVGGGRTVNIEIPSHGTAELLVNRNGQVVGSRGARNVFGSADGKQLDEVIGKEIAAKIMEDPDGDLSGNGLKVGGEGMKAFYDKIVPNTLKDVLRKVGGGVLETVDLGRADRARRHDLIRERRELAMDDPRRAELDGEIDRLGRMESGAMKPMQQPGFTITPAMREKVAGGLPLFARGPETPSASRFARSTGPASAATLSSVTDTIKTAMSPLGTVSLWDKTVGTQYNKATKDADFKRVFDGYVQQIDDTAHFAIEAETKAPDILLRLESAGDIWRGLLQGLDPRKAREHKANLEAVARPLFANIEGQTGIKQVRYDDETLRVAFSLTPKQIEMYHQARAAVDTSIERLAQTYAAQMGIEQGMEARDLKDYDLADTVAMVKTHIQDAHDEERAAYERARQMLSEITPEDEAADETAAEMAKHARTIPKGPSEEDTAAQLEKLDLIQSHAEFLQETGYMPALRFGQYAVTVTDTDGEVLHFEMFESKISANLAARALGKEYPGKQVQTGVMNPEQYAMFKGVSPETVALFAKFNGQDQSQAYKDYIALAKSARSVKMRELQRKGIAGFSEDPTRVLAAFLTSNARQSAINMNIGDITDALASKSLARKGDVQLQAQRLHEYMSNPLEEARSLRGFMFAHFMGGSIASALVNLTQPVIQTAPYLHQFAGAKTAGIMARAAKMAATGRIEDRELKDATARAAQDGITEPHEIHQLMADASSSGFGNSLKARALVKAWGSLFALTEAYNRRLTFLAAYQTATETGQADPYAFARKAVIETQGLYSKTNRPNWARGGLGATIFTFKQFQIAFIEFFNRLPRKQKVLVLTILVLAAGLQGLPFADDIEDLIDTIGQSMGYNTNAKKALRKMLVDNLGKDLGTVLDVGLLSALSSVDVQGRLGMGNLLPATAAFKPSETDKARTLSELAGPLGGLLTSYQKAAAALQRGDTVEGAREMLPVAVKNAVKGYEMASTGVYKDSRGYKVASVTGFESFVKMLGLQPSSIAAKTRVLSDEVQSKGMTTMMESMIADRWAQGVVERDLKTVAHARQTLAAWNAANPESLIVIKPTQIQTRVKKMLQDRDERFIKTVPQEQRSQVRKELLQ